MFLAEAGTATPAKPGVAFKVRVVCKGLFVGGIGGVEPTFGFEGFGIRVKGFVPSESPSDT